MNRSRDAAAAAAFRLGVDTGGTFTDFVWLDEQGQVKVYKTLSTAADPAAAVLSGVEALGVPEEVAIVHGSTVATNALLERRGARTALITTLGFADVLAIGRQDRPQLYALVPQKPPPLVPAEWRFGIAERVSSNGEVLQPLDETGLMPILAQFEAGEIESVAICFLFSFLRPEHERRVGQLIQAWDQARRGSGRGEAVHISLSSQILPEFREYERTSTTVINAYVAPLMSRYLGRLRDGLGPRHLTVMQSNGGILGGQAAGQEAARTVLSGPAGGVVGARYVASLSGYEQIITFDMGGTSTDVCLCPGRLPTTSEGEIGGLPLRLPIIDIHSVGAGGGSLAHVDAGGALHVGPQSAGADPGPVCYRAPGSELLPAADRARPIQEVTTTDANLVLGRLDADHFLGGEMRLNEAAAMAAMVRLAEQIGLDSAEAAAWGVVQVANANMERAIRRISVERGFDPRLFSLVAFGGAGPLHACELAQSLQIPTVLVPLAPGALSAMGMLAAPPSKDYSLTVMRRVDETDESLGRWLEGHFDRLAKRAAAEMQADGFGIKELTWQRNLDMRYVGQSYELAVPYDTENRAGFIQGFHQAHYQRYGFERPEQPVEIVNVRLATTAPIVLPQVLRRSPGEPDPSAAMVGRKLVWFGARSLPASLYDRDRLKPGNQLQGPAVVFQYDTTTLIPPKWSGIVDTLGHLILGIANT